MRRATRDGDRLFDEEGEGEASSLRMTDLHRDHENPG